MGLRSAIRGLAGGKGNDAGDALLVVFGEDKRFSRRKMASTGVHFQDNRNRLAYGSFPGGIGILSHKNNGRERMMGPVSIAFEPTTKLYNYPMLAWIEEEKPKEGQQTKRDVILDAGFAEGCARAVQNEDRQEWMSRLTTILLLAVLGAVLMAFLFGVQTGLLSDLFSGLTGFLGG